MKSSKKPISIAYIDRQGLDFFGSNITDKLIHLDFPLNIVSNIEILKRDELNILIKAFRLLMVR